MENEDNWRHSFERVIPDHVYQPFGLCPLCLFHIEQPTMVGNIPNAGMRHPYRFTVSG